MNLNSILIGSEDAQRLAAYYGRRFGEPAVPEPYRPDPASEALIASLAGADGNYFQLASPM
jgi:hypothetical protein